MFVDARDGHVPIARKADATETDLPTAVTFAREHGTHPAYTAAAGRENMATPQTYENRFVSWSAALRKAGLPTLAAITTTTTGDNGERDQ